MFCGFVRINNIFLDNFTPSEQNKIKNIIYSYYLLCGKNGHIGKKIGKEEYFKSNYIHYKFVYSYCPRCKISGVFLYPFGKLALDGLKYCGNCGISNISYRYLTGYEKIHRMLDSSDTIKKLGMSDSARDINQQIIALMVSVLEVYLRDCYAGILNTKFVSIDNSLFEKFIKDCKNDFLNPGKANERYKKELDIDIKQAVGKVIFSKLVELTEYRNVIVHNNGICDRRFVEANIGLHDIEQIIELNKKTLHSYFHAVNSAIKILDNLYIEVINRSIILELKYKLAIDDPKALQLFFLPEQMKPISSTKVRIAKRKT